MRVLGAFQRTQALARNRLVAAQWTRSALRVAIEGSDELCHSPHLLNEREVPETNIQALMIRIWTVLYRKYLSDIRVEKQKRRKCLACQWHGWC